ncbi:MAG: hypothetical protein ABEJ68_06580 [Halobacteriaceae archaeon]
MLGSGTFGHLRNPEYTGENRCLACTVVNVVIVATLSLAVALATAVGVGVAAFVVGVAAVYLRGYVVPGTPTLTQYLPDSVLRHFDHHDTTVPAAEMDDEPDPEAVLRRAGAVTECAEVDDLCLDETFRADWHAEMTAIRESASVEDLIRDALGEDAAVTEQEGDLIAHEQDRILGRWVSRTAAVADFAADRVLADRLSRWDAVPVARRSVVTRGLRPFLDRCPDCSDHVAAEKVTSCCVSGQARTVVHCPNCDTVLFESEPYTDLPAAGA